MKRQVYILLMIVAGIIAVCGSNNDERATTEDSASLSEMKGVPDSLTSNNTGNQFGDNTLVEDSIIEGEYIVLIKPVVADKISDSLFGKQGPITFPSFESKQKAMIREGFTEKLSAKDHLIVLLSANEYSFTVRTDSTTILELKKDKRILTISKNFIRTVTFPGQQETNAPSQELPWGVKRVSSSSKKDFAYTSSLWIIDTGVDPTHADLNCDNTHCKSFVTGEPVDDYIGHGTHVAGIAAAKADNKIGVIGVAPNARIRALKVFNKKRELDFGNSYLRALQYVKINGVANDVLNLSMSGYGEREDEKQLIMDIASKGIKVIVAAGNCDMNYNGMAANVETYQVPGKSLIGIYPANMNGNNIITVSGFDVNDVYSNCSNYGTAVDFSAPSENIKSTVPGGKWGLMSGTSMATPHVAGLFILKNGGRINSDGTVKNDPDSKKDFIAHE